jgi:hypothetical protein
MSEKFIGEQQKFINFYNVKKTYEKKSQDEFIELLTKKGNELSKLEMMDISLTAKNIENLSQQLKALNKQKNLNNVISSALSNI